MLQADALESSPTWAGKFAKLSPAPLTPEATLPRAPLGSSCPYAAPVVQVRPLILVIANVAAGALKEAVGLQAGLAFG